MIQIKSVPPSFFSSLVMGKKKREREEARKRININLLPEFLIFSNSLRKEAVFWY